MALGYFHMIFIIYADLSNAFDVLLRNNLSAWRCDKALNLFVSLVDDFIQNVQYENCTSKAKNINNAALKFRAFICYKLK